MKFPVRRGWDSKSLPEGRPKARGVGSLNIPSLPKLVGACNTYNFVSGMFWLKSEPIFRKTRAQISDALPTRQARAGLTHSRQRKTGKFS